MSADFVRISCLIDGLNGTVRSSLRKKQYGTILLLVCLSRPRDVLPLCEVRRAPCPGMDGGNPIPARSIVSEIIEGEREEE